MGESEFALTPRLSNNSDTLMRQGTIVMNLPVCLLYLRILIFDKILDRFLHMKFRTIQFSSSRRKARSQSYLSYEKKSLKFGIHGLPFSEG